MAGINNLNGMSNLFSSMTGTSGTTNSWQNNTLSGLFGGSNSNSNASSGMLGIDFSSYSSIKSGSYYKLLKKYYSSNASVDSNSEDVKKYQAKVDRMADASADLSYSLNELMHADFSTEKRDDLLKDVEKFIEDYNNTVSKAGDSDSKSVLLKAKWMTNMTKEYSNVLSDIGISVGSDNKLKLDTKAFQEADSDTLQGVFGTSPNSYANKVLYKAEQLYSLSKTYGSSATAYTSAGTYKKDQATTTANVVDQLL